MVRCWNVTGGELAGSSCFPGSCCGEVVSPALEMAVDCHGLRDKSRSRKVGRQLLSVT